MSEHLYQIMQKDETEILNYLNGLNDETLHRVACASAVQYGVISNRAEQMHQLHVLAKMLEVQRMKE